MLPVRNEEDRQKRGHSRATNSIARSVRRRRRFAKQWQSERRCSLAAVALSAPALVANCWLLVERAAKLWWNEKFNDQSHRTIREELCTLTQGVTSQRCLAFSSGTTLPLGKVLATATAKGKYSHVL
ncbi:hypothetical protein Y032_0622g760 [Ancylostoma ceylanicum]|uniref:Uncharacterized protein n=1 Tax=Ancylostoma ceylanicum TaxID=53326 RepID=A0A016WKU7_9BILA|nr:hypothetical protein Y032_0622g760 [Ancylostoma ceylanicum]